MNRDSEKHNVIPSISSLQLFRFASLRDKFYTTVGVITAIICALLQPLTVELIASLLESFSFVGESAPNKDLAKFYETVKSICIKLCLLGVLTFFLSYIGALLLKLAALHQVYKLRKKYLKAVLNQDFAYFDTNDTGDFAHKMTSNLMKFEEGINEKLGNFCYFTSLTFVSLIVAIARGWKLTLICFSVLPIIIIFIVCFSMVSNKMNAKEVKISSQSASVLEEVLSQVRTVQAFSGQKKEYERYRIISRNLKKICIKKDAMIGLIIGLIYVHSYILYCLAIWFGFMFILDGSYDLQRVQAVLMNIFGTFGNFPNLTASLALLSEARSSAASIYQVLDNVPTINPLLNRGEQPKQIKGDIELKDVHFHYPSRPDVPILKGVSLTVKAGQVVALIGTSGCGKSTIIQLLSRYYDPVEGSVTLDGRDVKTLPVRWLRAQIGFVRQEPNLFDTTIMENIRYGRENATNEDIVEAARLANAHDFITNLAQGYDTLVGASGASMSGGQKQRIAIARALVRNPTILLLDEATSALDNLSEALVQESLDKAQKGRTTIMIAHRLTTVQNADFIYVFEKGNIVEFGSPTDLIARNGIYYKMLIMQGLDPGKTNRLSRSLVIKYLEQEKTYDKPTVLEVSKDDTKKQEQVAFCNIIALSRPEWFFAMIACLWSVLMSCSNYLTSLQISRFIMVVNGGESAKSKVQNIVILLVTIGIFLGIIYGLQNLFYSICAHRLIERLKLKMFEKYLHYEMEFYDDKQNSVGTLCAKFSRNINNVQGAVMTERISITMTGLFTGLVTICVALMLHWKLGLIAFGFLPILLLVSYQEGKLDDATQVTQGLENSSKLAVEIVSNYKTVASLGMESKFVEEYSNYLQVALKASKKAAYFTSFIYAMSRSMSNFVSASIFCYAAYIIANQEGDATTSFMAANMVNMSTSVITGVLIFIPDIQKGLKAARNIIIELRRKVKIKDPNHPIIFKSYGSARLEEVKFKYPSRPHVTVFDGINLDIEPGKTTAIVGGSGSGKSTVIQLLERYYDPDAGTVKQSGIALPDIRLDDFRKTMGLVQQEPKLFDRTIGENIWYGFDSNPDMAMIHEAATLANIHSFIISLPEGYDTNVGKSGAQLSGGQKQRIALARALVRRPQLLLLDEATSTLDAESEKVVQEALDKGKQGRTCVVIAHRLSTIRSADVICVVHSGKVAERGTHDQLMQLKGHYYNLHNIM